MAINRASIAKELLPGLNAVFGIEYGSVEDEHKPLYEIESSDRAFEEEVLFTGVGAAPTKGEGAAVVYDDASESYTSSYTNDRVAIAFAVTEEAMEDNLYDTFAKLRAKGLARAMASTKQQKAADLYNNGFTTNQGDGVPMFSAAHPVTGTGTVTNSTTAAAIAEGTIEAAIIQIQKTTDDRGILVGASGVSLHVPTDLLFTADQLLNTPGTTGGANNDINAIRHLGVLPDGFYVNRRFTDVNAWFIKTDVPNGTKMFNRTPLQTKMEPDFDTGNLRFKARERYSFGVSDWRSWFGNQGA
jgi:hypothetical protein